jgi:serine/threonine protein kinase
MSSSVCVGSFDIPEDKRLTLAMKCLRPQARSNFEHFLVGVEDLVRETAILASLDHPNIIKLHGRAGDCFSKLSDGYFILVDRLQDTLQDKINRWAKSYPNSSKNAPSLDQLKVACTLSGALSYLHANNIVFRDLKPVSLMGTYTFLQCQIVS